MILVIFLFHALLNKCLCAREDLYLTKLSGKILNARDQDVIGSLNVSQPEDCLGKCRIQNECKAINIKRNEATFNYHFLKLDRFDLPKRSTIQSENYFLFQQKSSSFKGEVTNAKDCSDVYQRGFLEDGIYGINIGGNRLNVLCDMKTPPYVWTVFQRRIDGTVEFFRNWKEYKNGFGNLKSEFWLGNDHIHMLTKDRENSLQIVLELFTGEQITFHYNNFKIESEENLYKLIVSHPDAQTSSKDSLKYHNNMAFSTYDVDNDHHTGGSCALSCRGGWWYRLCTRANLNGKYFNYPGLLSAKETYDGAGISWRLFKGMNTSMKTTVMKLRRR